MVTIAEALHNSSFYDFDEMVGAVCINDYTVGKWFVKKENWENNLKTITDYLIINQNQIEDEHFIELNFYKQEKEDPIHCIKISKSEVQVN